MLNIDDLLQTGQLGNRRQDCRRGLNERAGAVGNAVDNIIRGVLGSILKK